MTVDFSSLISSVGAISLLAEDATPMLDYIEAHRSLVSVLAKF